MHLLAVILKPDVQCEGVLLVRNNDVMEYRYSGTEVQGAPHRLVPKLSSSPSPRGPRYMV
jgi:hypothetical protein